jgi:hypothetical protein
VNGRFVTAVASLGVPSVLLGVTYVWYAANPLAVLTLISVMAAGAFYLLSYRDR